MKHAFLIGVLLVAGLLVYSSWEVGFCRYYVPEGQSLMLRYKGPLPLMFWSKNTQAKPGYFAEEGEVGVLETLRGPGRHFYNPMFYERTLVDDIIIETGNVGIVTCKLGESLPSGEFLVDGDIGTTTHKGVLRKALHPGRYRINPYAYETKIVQLQVGDGKQKKHSGWVEIPTGYVGVVTNLSHNPILKQSAGIQPNVLPPGIYPINGIEQQIDIVKIGYRETAINVKKVVDASGKEKVDEAGEPIVEQTGNGIEFPSSDGFPIRMEYTAIWGLMPNEAPHAVSTFGNIEQIENKVVQPQIESICRNNGSEYKAVQLLVGHEREIYQQNTFDEFQKVLEEKQIELLFGLVKHIYIPLEVRQPIQKSFIADELTLTREQEQKTAQSEAELEQAKERITLASRTVEVNTATQVETKLAEGDREAGKIRAETRKLVAAIEKETAAIKAESVQLLGKAENDGKKLIEEAKATRFKLAVEAFGSPEAYNSWMFANTLPDNVDLKFIYAGPGTLWTDSKNLSIVVDQNKRPAEKGN